MTATLNHDADVCVVCMQAPARTDLGYALCEACLAEVPWLTDRRTW